MSNTPAAKKEKKDWRKEASVVMYVTFWNNINSPRTFYSRDASQKRHAGNIQYWLEHFDSYIKGKWAGTIKEYAIFKLDNGQRVGDPLVKHHF